LAGWGYDLNSNGEYELNSKLKLVNLQVKFHKVHKFIYRKYFFDKFDKYDKFPK
jgi:hypothetical protein